MTGIMPNLDYIRWKHPHYYHDVAEIRDASMLLSDGVHSLNITDSPLPLDPLLLGFDNGQGYEFLVVLSGAATESTCQQSKSPFFRGRYYE